MIWGHLKTKKLCFFFSILHIIFRSGWYSHGKGDRWCDLKCKNDSDCKEKETCTTDGSCQKICQNDKECRAGGICYADKQAEKKTCRSTCSHDSHCNQDQYCFSDFNACVEKCSIVGCPSGWTCRFGEFFASPDIFITRSCSKRPKTKSCRIQC